MEISGAAQASALFFEDSYTVEIDTGVCLFELNDEVLTRFVASDVLLKIKFERDALI